MKLFMSLILLQVSVLFEIIGYNFKDARASISIINAFEVVKCLPVNEIKIIQKKVTGEIVQEELFDVIRIKH